MFRRFIRTQITDQSNMSNEEELETEIKEYTEQVKINYLLKLFIP